MDIIDWKSLPFGYLKTDYNVRSYFKSGKWGDLEVTSSEFIEVHMAATGLHYGQEAFEGMKGFMGKDGQVRLFRWKDNANRMRRSAHGIMMAEVPEELFHQAITTAVKKNLRFVPPHGSGASLYIRPLEFGSGAQVGVKPANEYLFLVFVSPVGPYFKEGFKPVKIMITRKFDRAAPLGTGHIKVGGNYAASLRALDDAHGKGFASALFLDAREKKYVDEAGPANFFGIRDNTYITPNSHSILPSITNMSLQQIAKDMGLKVERRPVPVEEVPTFQEVGACGTAAVISPVKTIFDEESGQTFDVCPGGKAGPVSTKLYETLTGIQNGDLPDPYGWIEIV